MVWPSTAISCLHNIIKERTSLESNTYLPLLSRFLLSWMMLCRHKIAVDVDLISRHALQSWRKQEEQCGRLAQPQHLVITGRPGIILGFSQSWRQRGVVISFLLLSFWPSTDQTVMTPTRSACRDLQRYRQTCFRSQSHATCIGDSSIQQHGVTSVTPS